MSASDALPGRLLRRADTSLLTHSSLHQIAAWIRDDLDPLVSREGPKAIDPDDVLSIHSVLTALQQRPITEDTLRFSRIHLAVAEIAGKATRWPSKLIEEAESALKHLEGTMGPLRRLKTPLFERGGRLWGICLPSDTSREALLRRFGESEATKVDAESVYHHNSHAWKPGQWWINALFACRDGIIDTKSLDFGITCDAKGAYAIVLTGSDEFNSPNPRQFSYRCRRYDKGTARLTAADFRSRYPVRVLRDHRLHSLWAPRSGIRYDGLYRVTGWTMRPIPASSPTNTSQAGRFEVHFLADSYFLPGSTDDPQIDVRFWEKLMSIPTAEEHDDYKMYGLVAREQRERQRHGEAAFSPPTQKLANIDVEIPSVPASRQLSLDVSGEAAGFWQGEPVPPTLSPVSEQERPGSGSSEGGSVGERHGVDGVSERVRAVGYSPPWDLHSQSDCELASTSGLQSLAALRNLSEPYERRWKYDGSADSLRSMPTGDSPGFSVVEPARVVPPRQQRQQRQQPRQMQLQMQMQTLGTGFRPVCWGPMVAVELAAVEPWSMNVFGLSEETLDLIAPFRDRGQRPSEGRGVSPRGLRGRRGRRSASGADTGGR